MTTIASEWTDESPLIDGDRGTADERPGGRPPGRRLRPTRHTVALAALLVASAALYLWGLGAEGWANSFYAAAVQAGTKSWKAFFFGSSDAANFITVDKPPASLWVMEISSRIFGLNAWSLLVPQALEGVATVGVLYATVRRWSGPVAGLIAGAVVALTPVAALMFRYDNPDSLLVLLLTSAAYATTRALESGRTRWLAAAMALVGTGFITKMLQAFLVLPALGLVYLFCGPPRLGRRIAQLAWSTGALIVSAGWWVAAVTLTPAADRPYVGGSADNSILNLIFGYNGFGRVDGAENGSTAIQWGPTGWDRLFLPSFGSQISWLIPGALILLAVTLWLRRKAPRTDRIRAALVIWGGWLVITGLLLSYAKGIIHPYYTVALAPAIGGVVAIGVTALWPHRGTILGRWTYAAALLVTSVWAFVLMGRAETWVPELRTAILVVGAMVAAAIVIAPMAGRPVGHTVAAAALIVALAGPAAYTLETVATAHSGAIPSAGPTAAGSQGGPGNTLGGAGNPFGGSRGGPAGRAGGAPGGFAGTAGPNTRASTAVSGRGTGGPRSTHPAGAAGAAGGLLDSSTPSSALTRLLAADATHYTWIAATVGSNSASGYQLATDDPVMAIGGFNGTDPAPTLAQFERYVAQGKIHYFIAGGGQGGGSGGGSSTSNASAITSWVEAHFTAQTTGGVTLYDLNAAHGS